MSAIEVERFVADVKQNQTLLRELTEGVIGIDEMTARARAKGYTFTPDEAKAFAKASFESEMSPVELDRVQGGLERNVVVTEISQTINTVAIALIIGIVNQNVGE